MRWRRRRCGSASRGSMRIRFEGALRAGVTAKDLALHIIGTLGAAAGVGYAIEYAGPAIEAMDGRGPADAVQPVGRAGRALRPGRARRDAPSTTCAAGRFAPQGAAFDAAVGRLAARCRSDADAALRPRGSRSTPPRSRRPSPGAPAPSTRSRSTAACPIRRTRPTPTQRDTLARRARLHGPARPGSRSPARRWTGCSSAPAPIRGCPTCAPPPRSRAAGRSRRASPPGSCPAPRASSARPRPRGCDEVFRGRRLRVARAGLQHVRGGQRRAGAAAAALGVDLQPQLRRPPGAGRAHPSRQPGHGRGGRDRRGDRRRAEALSDHATLHRRHRRRGPAAARQRRHRRHHPHRAAHHARARTSSVPTPSRRCATARTAARTPTSCFNQPAFRDAPILLAGDNFGCGSSREGAVWALQGTGRALRHRAELRRHLLQQLLPERHAADPPARLRRSRRWPRPARTASRSRSTCSSARIQAAGGVATPFTVDPLRREALLHGLDDIGLTLKDEPLIRAWQEADRQRRPWAWPLAA